MMTLVEESSGVGELTLNGVVLCQVRYQVCRFQGMMEGSGLPIPGLHRIEGFLEFNPDTDPSEWISVPMSLRLEDGRVIGIAVVNKEGGILSEGHGPSRCLCC